MDYLQRIKRVQQILLSASLDALVVESPIDLYYLTGFHVSRGTLLIHLEGAHLLVDNRYIEHCQATSPIPVLLSDQFPLNQVLQQPSFGFIRRLGFDSGHCSYQEFLDLQHSLSHLTQKIELCPLACPLMQLRIFKEEEEITCLRAAAQLGSEGYDYLVSTQLKEGITEAELALELEMFWRKNGAQGVAFDPIIAFGMHSSMPHYRAGSQSLQKGMVVLIDIGVRYQDYHSDMTRTLFFGDPDPQLLPIYSIVKKAQELALELCRPGVQVGEIDRSAREYIKQMGYADFFKHSLGHGIGLEVHEAPFLKQKAPDGERRLEVGMVITVEPGIYLPRLGGVRIEDTIAITADGHENLTRRSSEMMLIGLR
jgi:Xaa-Pro aminopeptidase